ncbi:hypothetical protein [Leptospira noguchii]|uniref:hypothetical protein n=1 Tax=Leptospira noguchii TaxID=28182 RepID=UPI0012F81599|nr:hypothetical protein [Leptospira noguchii]
MENIRIFKKVFILLVVFFLVLGEIQGKEEHEVKRGSKEYNAVLNFTQKFINVYVKSVLGQKPSYVKYAALSQLTYIKWNPYQAASE